MYEMFLPFALSLLRQALIAAGTTAVIKGYLDESTVTQLVGAVIAAISSVLSLKAVKSSVEAKAVVKTLGANDPHRVL